MEDKDIEKSIKLAQYKDYASLYSDMSKLHYNSCSLIIDMSDLKFIGPTQILILVLFTIFHINKKCRIKYILPLAPRVFNYIWQIGLLEFCRTNYKKSQTLNSIDSLTAMPIRRLDTKNMDGYINYAHEYFRKICPEKDLSMLNLSIAELINNVYDHSNSPIDAYAFCQYFPKVKKITVVVADLGIGIPEVVNSYFKRTGEEVVSNKEALKWALEENHSTRSRPHNKGKGLANLYSFAKSTKGLLRIFSNDVEFNGYSYKSHYQENPIPNFIGTIVEVSFYIEELPEKELDESDYIDSLW